MTTTKAKAARMLQHPDGREDERLSALSSLSSYHRQSAHVNKIMKGKSYMRGLKVNIGNAC